MIDFTLFLPVVFFICFAVAFVASRNLIKMKDDDRT